MLAGGAPQALQREGTGGRGHHAPHASGGWGEQERLQSPWGGTEPRRGGLLAGRCVGSPHSRPPSAPISEPSQGAASPAFGPQPDPALLKPSAIPTCPAVERAKLPAGLRTRWCLQSLPVKGTRPPRCWRGLGGDGCGARLGGVQNQGSLVEELQV